MKNSKIEWTDHTFNPWIGCAKVSTGCANCYAGIYGTRKRTSPTYWRGPIFWNKEAAQSKVRPRVFCGSLCDVFEDRPELDSSRIDLMMLIEKTPYLDWLLLTKRPENVKPLIERAQEQAGAGVYADTWIMRTGVWIGTSVEDQDAADKRIPHLLKIPAQVRFLSMEPLLGPVDLHQIPTGDERYPYLNALTGIRWREVTILPDGTSLRSFDEDTYFDTTPYTVDWVIVGGESGHNARPMDPEWTLSIRNQCQFADVPFYFKQWGEWWPHDQGEWIGGPSIDPDAPDAEFYKVGKHAAGRLLNGREWNEFPTSLYDEI